MKDIKKVGLTALAGSLAAISANAAEMSVSGATLLTYTSEDPTEVTGNPWGMKTNLAFTASGDVNGYTVSYYQASQDQFAGMSSASLSIDMGDLGKIRFDQGAGSGLNNIDDKTPTAAEEIWDGLDGTTTGGLVGAAGSSGVFNYINSFGGVTFNGAFRKGSGAKNSDGSSSGAGGSAWDFAITGTGEMLGVDGFLYNDGQTTLSHGRFGTDGDAQNSIYILRGTTTDATFTTIQNNGAHVKLASNRSMMFTAHIIGRRTDTINASTNDNAAYILKGSIFNDGYGAAIVGSVTKTVIAETDSNWDVQATITGGGAGATDQINIQCKGASSKTVNWVIKLELLEVGGNVTGYTEANIFSNMSAELIP